jgi:hypothetical protein
MSLGGPNTQGYFLPDSGAVERAMDEKKAATDARLGPDE